jgi:hypothetical protein
VSAALHRLAAPATRQYLPPYSERLRRALGVLAVLIGIVISMGNPVRLHSDLLLFCIMVYQYYFQQTRESSMAFNSIEEIIEDYRQGKMVLLVDDEDRENEGDLLLAADRCTPRPSASWPVKHAG